MEIIYCARCGRVIPPGGLDAGKHFLVGEDPVCPACYHKVPEEEHTGDTVVKEDKIERRARAELVPAAAGWAGRGSRKSSGRMAKPSGAAARVYLAGGIAAALIGILVLVVVFTRGGGPNTPSPAPGGSTGPAAKPLPRAVAAAPEGSTEPDFTRPNPASGRPAPKPKPGGPARPALPVEEPKTPVAPAAGELKPGLAVEFFKFQEGEEANFLPAGHGRKPDIRRTDAQINWESVDGEFAKSGLREKFHAVWSGVLRVPAAGKYRFGLNSDDGSRLTLDGRELVANGGEHAMEEKTGELELTAGDHPIVVELFQGGGSVGCVLTWTPPGGEAVAVPASALFHRE